MAKHVQCAQCRQVKQRLIYHTNMAVYLCDPCMDGVLSTTYCGICSSKVGAGNVEWSRRMQHFACGKCLTIAEGS